MRWYSLVACLAGCGFEPGSFSRDPDAGVTSEIDGAVEVDAFVDTDADGDGVLSSTDNCPSVQNADQRNHDGDARGDECDLCPHLDTGAVDPDGDGDGIGDSCDPRPAAGGDTLVIWDGYYDNSQRATWVGLGTWAVDDGYLEQTDATLNQAYTYPPGLVDRHAITVGARIDVLGTVSGSVVPAVYIAGGSNGQVQYYICGAYQSQIYGQTRWPVGMNSSDGDFNTMTWPGTFAAGSEMRLSTVVAGGEHRCAASQGTTTVTVTQEHGGTRGAVVLLTQRMAASFDYVHVVAVGN